MYYFILAALIAIDQILKVIVRGSMVVGEKIPVLGDVFTIQYIENTGMAFGMLAGSRIFLTVVPVIVLIAAFVIWRKYKDRYKPILGISVMMVIAGGASNVFDRIVFGSVTDYLSLKGFAIFNFADICACVGCALLCISIFFFEKKEIAK